MKKLFLSLCLFLAISSVFAQNFVPDPNKIYNIVESTSNRVIGVGAAGSQPALYDKANVASQAFKFVPTGENDSTYYLLSSTGMYLNKSASQNWTPVAEAAINGTNSQWVIRGTDATTIGIRLKNVNNSQFIAADGTPPGSGASLWTDKAVDNANGLYKLQEAAITTFTLYFENFEADFAPSGNVETFAPSTKAGKWIGGKDLVTDLDSVIQLRGDNGGWSSHGYTLQMAPTTSASPSAAVIIPDIAITGYDSLKLSFENVWLYWTSGENAFGSNPRSERSPVIEIKSGTGSWIALATDTLKGDWTTQTLTLPAVDNKLPLSIRISGSMRYTYIINDLLLTGKIVTAHNFVPDPNKVYNIVESGSNNVVGPSGVGSTQPALTDKQDLASQAFHFVSTGVNDTTYYLLNEDKKYLNKSGTQNWVSILEDTISGTNSKWAIVGADATGIRLKNINNGSYLAADATSYGSTLWTDKAVDNPRGLYKLQEATIYTGTPTTLYNEPFSPVGVDVNANWIGAPSTLAGANNWSGGIDLQTEGDGNMTLASQWSNLRLKLTSADSAVIIPDINVAGYTNLQFSIDGYREDSPLAPILDVKVGTGDWVSQSTQGVGNYWNWTTAVTSLKDAGGIQLSNVSTISLKISVTDPSTSLYYLDNVKVLGRAPSIPTSLSNKSMDVFSVYPNPATNYILTKNAQKVTIVDLNGRIVKEAINTEKVDVSSLANGAYIVKVKIDNATKIGKLIKE